MMTRVFRKCQFTDPNDRVLLTTKIASEITNLEQWFKSMTSSLPDQVI